MPVSPNHVTPPRRARCEYFLRRRYCHYNNATKFAVEGLSEALAQEFAPLGMRVIIVEPGSFLTEFLWRSIATAAQPIPAYAATAGRLRAYRQSSHRQQDGDPVEAAAAILQAVDTERPPLHLPLAQSHADLSQFMDVTRFWLSSFFGLWSSAHRGHIGREASRAHPGSAT